MRLPKYAKLILAIVACQAAGFVGSLFTSPQISTWYAGLARPSFAPPNWLFAPVWTTLFLLMGIAWYLIWQKAAESRRARWAAGLFSVHLAFNTAWSVIFFGLRQPGWAFLEIIALLIMIATLTVWFWRLDRRAGLLMIPYLLWVSFASVLNLAIWRLNA